MCVEEQNMLGTEEKETKFLGILGEEEMRAEVKAIFNKHSTSVKKWEAFVNFYKEQIQSVSISLIRNYYSNRHRLMNILH